VASAMSGVTAVWTHVGGLRQLLVVGRVRLDCEVIPVQQRDGWWCRCIVENSSGAIRLAGSVPPTFLKVIEFDSCYKTRMDTATQCCRCDRNTSGV
jgi:hypothetical protein